MPPKVSPFAAALAEAVAQSRPGGRCTVATLLASLDDETAGEVVATLALPTRDMPHTAVAAAVNKAFGVKLHHDVVGRHRRGLCRCSR